MTISLAREPGTRLHFVRALAVSCVVLSFAGCDREALIDAAVDDAPDAGAPAASTPPPAPASCSASGFDSSFADHGTRVLSTFYAQVAAQHDSRILLVESVGPHLDATAFTPAHTRISRVDSYGVAEPAFGTGGGLDLTGTFALTPLADGRTLITGEALERLNSDGSIDGSFGVGGFVQLGDGNVVLSVGSDGSLLTCENGLPTAVQLGRLDANGEPSIGFGFAGTVTTPFDSPFYLCTPASIIQTNGAYVASIYGQLNPPGDVPSDFRAGQQLVGLTANGEVDSSFGDQGVVYDAEAFSVGLVPTAAGGFVSLTAVGTENPTRYELRKYLFNGRLDPSFGNGGVTNVFTPDDPDALNRPELSGPLLLANGSMLVYRLDQSTLGKTTTWTLSFQRYSANGLIDETFANGGVLAVQTTTPALGVPLGGANQLWHVSTATVQPDGKVIVSIAVQGASYTFGAMPTNEVSQTNIMRLCL